MRPMNATERWRLRRTDLCAGEPWPVGLDTQEGTTTVKITDEGAVISVWHIEYAGQVPTE